MTLLLFFVHLRSKKLYLAFVLLRDGGRDIWTRYEWEGDPLVVNTIGFRDDLWIDWNGSVVTSAGKIQERIRRPDYGHLEVGPANDWKVKVRSARAY
jgi:hypothetical protein